MNRPKGAPLSKDEVKTLVELVEVNPVVFSKATNNSNNQLKEAAWNKITDQFNSSIASCPRTVDQLRLKWENLKKTARKRSTKIRMNNIKTGGGKPDFIPPDEVLDKVASILGATCDGYSVQFGGDAVEVLLDSEEVVEEVAEVAEFVVPFLGNEVLDTSVGVTSFETPKNKKFFFSSINKEKMKRKAAVDDLKKSIKDRNEALTKYYDMKRRNKEEIYKLKKRKLELEILEKENNP